MVKICLTLVNHSDVVVLSVHEKLLITQGRVWKSDRYLRLFKLWSLQSQIYRLMHIFLRNHIGFSHFARTQVWHNLRNDPVLSSGTVSPELLLLWLAWFRHTQWRSCVSLLWIERISRSSLVATKSLSQLLTSLEEQHLWIVSVELQLLLERFGRWTEIFCIIWFDTEDIWGILLVVSLCTAHELL